MYSYLVHTGNVIVFMFSTLMHAFSDIISCCAVCIGNMHTVILLACISLQVAHSICHAFAIILLTKTSDAHYKDVL